ncbi:MAG TPA: glutamine ABC transporter ATP-binding protein, partial [Micrococcales bacterium]|nr:glutamine ABC transporter ATP-binding protein [Micrococcales bacterium]
MSPTDLTPTQELLTVRGLTNRFGQRQVLDSVDLTVRRGQVLAVIGSSGSGKTTLLRCLNGLEVPDGGTVALADAKVDFARRPSRADLGRLRDRSAMVFQHHNLFPHKTVLGNITEGPLVVQRRARTLVEAEASALLRRVGLADRSDAYPHQLSGGEQQRVGILRALAVHPQLLLFDEPTSALDPELV